MTCPRWTSICAVALLPLLGCAETAQRGGLPACEPPGELVLERGLKTGFRALSEHDWGSARAAFEGVLESVPGHPEARAGLRATTTLPGATSPRAYQRGLIVGEHELQTQHPVDHDSLRLEARGAERAAASGFGKARLPAPVAFKLRTTGSPTSLAGIDLVVLHATGTLTALERFVRSQYQAESAHFLIDWDGSVYQTLDLARIARHTGSPALDARSVAIELVTPTKQESNPLPSEAEGVERPMSQRLRIQGKTVRNWGYTSLQMKSLKSLLADLVRLLPDLEATLVGGVKVPMKALPPAQRKTVRGIVGRLHLDPRSRSPGPGFDWSALRTERQR
jgi:N-acetyl-anhydromuramyl-L-alanine amidase AmpD